MKDKCIHIISRYPVISIKDKAYVSGCYLADRVNFKDVKHLISKNNWQLFLNRNFSIGKEFFIQNDFSSLLNNDAEKLSVFFCKKTNKNLNEFSFLKIRERPIFDFGQRLSQELSFCNN